jgi:hypothetical protein
MKSKAISLLLGICLAASLASAATIERSTIADNQLKIQGTFSLPVKSVSLGSTTLTVVSSSTTEIVATVSPLPPIGTYRLAVHDASSNNVGSVTVSADTLAGYANSNGTIYSGSGFTVIRNEAGNYKVSWVAGTFQCCGALPVLYARSTFGNTTGNIQFITFNGDGSGSFGLDFAGVDTNFVFSMTQIY